MDLAVRVGAIAMAFGLTIFVHEAGHFIAARLSRMTVHEFSIGFGRPLLFWFRRGGTQYSFRFWPFLSYVRIAGMEPGEDEPNGFYRKSRGRQAFVLGMGSTMNFLLAVAIFVFIGAVLGRPVERTSVVERVLRGTPAESVGLQAGDRLIGIDGDTDLSLEAIQKQIMASPGVPLSLEIDREGERLSVPVTPRRETIQELDDNDRVVERVVGRVGIVFHQRMERLGIGASIVEGFRDTFLMIYLLTSHIFDLVQRWQAPALIGPVGVVQTMYNEAKVSWAAFLFVFAAVTVSIGFLNLLPVPPLDGSRLLIVGLEAIRRKPFDKRKEMWLHLVGYALILTLFFVLTYKDILRGIGLRGQ
jgi:regulator of sigma E protease